MALIVISIFLFKQLKARLVGYCWADRARSGHCRGLQEGKAKPVKGGKRQKLGRGINMLESMNASTNKILCYCTVKKEWDSEVIYTINT